MTTAPTLRIAPRGPFALAASRAFLHGFTPGAGTAETSGGPLVLAFRLDGCFDAVAVALEQRGDVVVGEVRGTRDVDAAARQVARVLSLDHDAAGWAALGARDPVIGRLQAEKPGFRPVCFPSAYEAALWGVLAQRMPMARAATLKRALASELGDAVDIAGRTMHVAPRPERLAALESFPGIPELKVERLRAVGRAAADGVLDSARLRALDADEALADLRALPGVGPWTAEHILMRGTGPTDTLPSAEPRVFEAVRQAFGLAVPPSLSALARLAEAWRPWRMWVSVLAVSALAGTPAWGARRGPRACGVAA
jgi:DNA-3-methyladenine glycosylase II